MPLGIMDVTEYEQFDVEAGIQATVVLSYTDALIESAMQMGKCLARPELLRILRLLGTWSRDY